MRGSSLRKGLAVASVLAVGASTVVATNGTAHASQLTTESLAGAAQAAVEQRTQTLIGGAGSAAVTSKKSAARLDGSAAGQQAAAVAEVDNRRKVLAEAGEAYVGAKTQLLDVKTSRSGNKIVLEAKEYSTIWLKDAGDGPQYTQQVVPRRFEFKVSGRNSKLVAESRTDNATLPAINDASGTSTTEARNGVQAMQQAPKGQLTPQESAENSGQAYQPAGPRKGSRTKLSVSKATKYAYKWWNARNKKYPNFKDQDCTNFASQVLHAGGWRYTKRRSTSGTKSWYFKSKRGRYSATWINADYLGKWVQRKRAKRIASKKNAPYKLRLGDVLQMDRDRSGAREHAMFVTRVKTDSRGNVVDVYLTYHSVDTKDRSLRSIIAQYPKAWYYGLRTKKK